MRIRNGDIKEVLFVDKIVYKENLWEIINNYK